MFVDEKHIAPIEAPKVRPLWAQILLDAADYIEKHGWVQRMARAGDGRVCAAQAIAETGHQIIGNASVFLPVEDPTNIAMRKLISFVGASSIPGWNDGPGRTKEQVCAALRGAANAG